MNNKKILEEKLNENPRNIDLLFKLALLEMMPPEGDDIKCTAYLEQILALDKDNVQALLLLAYLKYHCLFEHADEYLMNKLTSLKGPFNELNSMLRFAASWFFQFQGDTEKQIFFLQESITLDPRNVWNYFDLAQIYFGQDKKLEAKELVHKALANIQKIYLNGAFEYDETNLSDFLNHHIKGIFVNQPQLNLINKQLSQ